MGSSMEYFEPVFQKKTWKNEIIFRKSVEPEELEMWLKKKVAVPSHIFAGTLQSLYLLNFFYSEADLRQGFFLWRSSPKIVPPRIRTAPATWRTVSRSCSRRAEKSRADRLNAMKHFRRRGMIFLTCWRKMRSRKKHSVMLRENTTRFLLNWQDWNVQGTHWLRKQVKQSEKNMTE